MTQTNADLGSQPKMGIRGKSPGMVKMAGLIMTTSPSDWSGYMADSTMYPRCQKRSLLVQSAIRLRECTPSHDAASCRVTEVTSLQPDCCSRQPKNALESRERRYSKKTELPHHRAETCMWDWDHCYMLNHSTICCKVIEHWIYSAK